MTALQYYNYSITDRSSWHLAIAGVSVSDAHGVTRIIQDIIHLMGG